MGIPEKWTQVKFMLSFPYITYRS